MNRIIKVRAFDQNIGVFHYWDSSTQKFDNTFWDIVKKESLIPSEFTGLQDKNKKDIYEGDIVDYGNGRFKPVEFINGCFCICGITSMPTLMSLYPIVGNIYENPELLK